MSELTVKSVKFWCPNDIFTGTSPHYAFACNPEGKIKEHQWEMHIKMKGEFTHKGVNYHNIKVVVSPFGGGRKARWYGDRLDGQGELTKSAKIKLADVYGRSVIDLSIEAMPACQKIFYRQIAARLTETYKRTFAAAEKMKSRATEIQRRI